MKFNNQRQTSVHNRERGGGTGYSNGTQAHPRVRGWLPPLTDS